jgi:hypothetical protein
MARYGTQEWRDNISLAKRLKSAERRRKMLSLEDYREQVVEERGHEEQPFRIDFDTLIEDAMHVTRPFAGRREA